METGQFKSNITTIFTPIFIEKNTNSWKSKAAHRNESLQM